jgi:hypothetical protein|tara:strand:+ start:2185 stop:2418 length:234 start_codon:yes stop_codon:yes gene_type:complete
VGEKSGGKDKINRVMTILVMSKMSIKKMQTNIKTIKKIIIIYYFYHILHTEWGKRVGEKFLHFFYKIVYYTRNKRRT